MRRVGEQRADRHDQLSAELVAGSEHLGGELPPAHVGLDPADQDQVAVEVRRRGHRDPGARPGQPPVPVVVGPDDRPVDLEVVEVLGVDRADHAGVPHPHQVIDRRGRRLGRVVPALERRDDDRVDQVGGVVDLDHPVTLITRTTAPTVISRAAISGGPDRPVSRSRPARCHHPGTPSTPRTASLGWNPPRPTRRTPRAPRGDPCPHRTTDPMRRRRSPPRCRSASWWSTAPWAR